MIIVIGIFVSCTNNPTEHKIGKNQVDNKKIQKISDVVTKNYYFDNGVSVAYEKGDCFGFSDWNAFFVFEFLKKGCYSVKFVSSSKTRNQYPSDFNVQVLTKDPLIIRKDKNQNCVPLNVKILITYQSSDTISLEEEKYFFDPSTGR